MTTQIRIKFDKDRHRTNLFTIPDPIYRYIYEADTLSNVYVRKQRIFLALANSIDKSSLSIVRIFVLKPLELISSQILSCQLVFNNEEFEIQAKETIQTSLERAFTFKHKMTSNFPQQLQQTLDSWYTSQFNE